MKAKAKYDMSELPNQNEVGDNCFPIVTICLHNLLEMIMTDSYDLRKPPTSHCKRLGDIEHNSYFSCHASRLQFQQKLK